MKYSRREIIQRFSILAFLKPRLTDQLSAHLITLLALGTPVPIPMQKTDEAKTLLRRRGKT